MASNNLEYTLRLKDLFSKTMQGAANQVKGLDSKMSSLKQGLGSMKTMIAGTFAVGAVVSFGKAVIESLKNYQYFHASLKTMLHGNENATASLESQLIKLAATTPFELTEVQTATKQLLAYGFKAGDVIDTMRTLGDVSSGIGAPLGDIAYLYGTLKTSGRVTLMDLRQFAGRGIPIYETLAKRLNTTTNGINKMVHDGKLGFKDIEGAFKDMTKEGGQFFNLMADQSKTVGGQLSNMADSWEQLKVNIGKSQTGIIASTINMVSSMLGEINKAIAGSNAMDEAFSAKKLQGPSVLETIGGIFGNTELRGQRNLVRELTSMSDFANSKNSEVALRTQREFMYAGKMKESKAFTSGQISKEDYDKRLSIYDYFINNLAGGLDVLKTKENKTLGLGTDNNSLGGEKSTSKSLGTGTEVTGQRPQSLTINITKLVESLNVQTTNMTEGATKIKEMVSKALLEAVNDANLTAMT
jgi:tape measure domain-containing protein